MNFDTIAPFLAASGQALIDLDENKEGADDFAGELLVYVTDVKNASDHNEDLPPLPEVLANGTTGKISGGLKATLKVANPLIMMASFSVKGKAAKVLRYASQAISQMLADRPVPPAPVF